MATGKVDAGVDEASFSDTTSASASEAGRSRGDNTLADGETGPPDGDAREDLGPTRDTATASVPDAIPVTVDDFLRNVLVRKGLTRTLEVFEREWYGKRLSRAGNAAAEFVPDALTHNRLLRAELVDLCRERDALERSALEAGETLIQIRKETDLLHARYRRAALEKNRLTEDVRRLKKHRASCGPAPARPEETRRRAQTAQGVETSRVSCVEPALPARTRARTPGPKPTVALANLDKR
ncbi:uncharacterized protein LOC130121971 [Lampris incognitus]|uniref:uncharacterized protein LOC130121971 n=1 Tax=Lampris incognitus TaxID=2546036 RepID=UPI0024B62F48|nr:uncharacterized protein LOC130121971 [Lampris incognitus]XP_056146944.1 uncharacterized protein LOC130121971 [Lampris incognitus]